MTGALTCDGCAFWVRHGPKYGTCQRRPPLPAEGPDQIAHWPMTGSGEGCGDATPPDPARTALTTCGKCRFWRSNPGGGLDPFDRGDARREWWSLAGHCIRHAPMPSSSPGCRGFWRATHASDCCAEGAASSPDEAG